MEKYRVRCDTCPEAVWEPGCSTEVWCEKKKRYIKVGRTRHLFVAAKDVSQHRRSQLNRPLRIKGRRS